MSTIDRPSWLASGAALAIILFLVGIFIKEQTDVSALIQAEKDHTEEDDKQFSQIQAQIDRRIASTDKFNEIQEARIIKLTDQTSANAAIVNDVKVTVEGMKQTIIGLASALTNGHNERISEDLQLSKRIDEMQSRLIEIQRQTSAIEGKLGESVPNPSLGIDHH